jgi:hypothetical protein
MRIIGGPTPEERNVISGNRGHGLILGGRGHRVRGNYIGVNINGAGLGNQFDGIIIARAPVDFTEAAKAPGTKSSIPDVSFVRFRFVESPFARATYVWRRSGHSFAWSRYVIQPALVRQSNETLPGVSIISSSEK